MQSSETRTFLGGRVAGQQPGTTESRNDTDGGTVIPLTKPIATHHGDISTVTLRAATMRDYIANGDIDTPEASEFVDGRATVIRTYTDRTALVNWAVALSGLDRIVLGELSAKDAGLVFAAVRRAVDPFSKGN